MSVAAKGLAHVGVGPFPEVTGIRRPGLLKFSRRCRYLRRPEWLRRWLGCADDVGGGVAERFERSEQLVDAADRNDRNSEAFSVEVEIDHIDLATFSEAKLDHKRLAAFALQFSAKDRASPCQLAALVCVKNPTCDELRGTGDGDRIVKCHRPRRVTHHQVEREIAIVEIAPAFYRHRDVAVGYCVREKSNLWVHQLPRKLTHIDLLATTRLGLEIDTGCARHRSGRAAKHGALQWGCAFAEMLYPPAGRRACPVRVLVVRKRLAAALTAGDLGKVGALGHFREFDGFLSGSASDADSNQY